ncbi:MAG: VOC family protein [Thiohalomonadaceae bacterium]
MNTRLDHLVLTVTDPEATARWYGNVLGFECVRFGEGRLALMFDGGKINLHEAGNEFLPHARHPQPGSADLCFVVGQPLMPFINHIKALGIGIEAGPVARTGSRRPLLSVYIRDPDGNLIEIANEI